MYRYKKVNFTKGTGISEKYFNWKQYTPWYYSKDNEISVIFEDGITSIGNNMFYGCTGLKNVHWASTITAVNSYAFYNCPNMLSEVNFGNITNIGEYAFYNCAKITGKLNSENLTAIKQYSFYGCTGITGNLNLSNTTTLEQYAFYKCSGLTGSVDLKNYKILDGYIFYGCSGIEEIKNLDDVTEIGDYTFYGCTGAQGNVNLNKIVNLGRNAFENCEKINSVIIGDTIEALSKSSFKNCIGLTEITFPNSIDIAVDTGSQSVFYGVSNLKSIRITKGSGKTINYTSEGGMSTPMYYSRNNELSITFEDGITSIGNYMLYNCIGATKLCVPQSVIKIGEYAFYNCSSIVSDVDISNVSTLGVYSFYNCQKMLGNWNFSPELNEIREYTFYNCNSRIGDLDLNNFTKINDYVFYECSGISGILNSDNITTIGKYAFYNCVGLTGKVSLNGIEQMNSYGFYNCTGITEVEIGDGITNTYYHSTFANCTNIAKLKLPISMYTVGDSNYPIFKNATNLKEIILTKGTGDAYNYSSYYTGTPWYYSRENELTITIEDGVKSIGENMFNNCTGIKNITIPDSVESIGNSAFKNCTNIESEIRLENFTNIASYAFYNCKKIQGTWDFASDLDKINEYAFYNCISRKGNIDFSNIKEIGQYVFYGCEGIKGNIDLNNLSIINDYTFYSCTGINGVINSNNILTLGSYAFYKCTGITGKISLAGIEKMNSYGFYNCTGITEVEIGDGITNPYYHSTFANCTNITKLKLPISMYTVGDSNYPIFKDVTNLKEIILTKGTGYAYNYSSGYYTGTPWYYSRNNELTITLEEGIDSIGTNIFKNCTGLTYIYIPKSLTKISNSAFSGCTGIRQVNYNGSASDWQSIAFEDGNDEIKLLSTPGVLNDNNGIADTGIVLSGNYKIEAKIKNTSYKGSYNYVYSTGKNDFETYIDATNKQLHFTSAGISEKSSSTINVNQVYVLSEEVKDGTMKANVNGEEWITGTSSSGTSGSVRLFASSSDNYTTNMVIYYFKIYKDDTLVLDLEPAIKGNSYDGKTSEKNGFYDKVQKRFLYSNNTEFGLEGGVINCNEK